MREMCTHVHVWSRARGWVEDCLCFNSQCFVCLDDQRVEQKNQYANLPATVGNSIMAKWKGVRFIYCKSAMPCLVYSNKTSGGQWGLFRNSANIPGCFMFTTFTHSWRSYLSLAADYVRCVLIHVHFVQISCWCGSDSRFQMRALCSPLHWCCPHISYHSISPCINIPFGFHASTWGQYLWLH